MQIGIDLGATKIEYVLLDNIVGGTGIFYDGKKYNMWTPLDKTITNLAQLKTNTYKMSDFIQSIQSHQMNKTSEITNISLKV